MAFLSAISHQAEPTLFSQVVKHAPWHEAMEVEMPALETNNTWTLEHLPHDKKLIGYKWVYKIKYRANDTIDHFKARLVAKGYTQKEGLDFH